MFAILGFSLCLLLVMLVIPDSPLGRVLHRQLVERPLERLAQLERHHLIYAVIIGSMMIAGGEAVAIAGPELVAMWALDVSIYLDAVLVTDGYPPTLLDQARAAILDNVFPGRVAARADQP